MSNYYNKRDAKVRLVEELSNRGWEIFGYKEDRSDSMTDYYSPANWSGIASKNGYVLVVDCKSNSDSGRDITRYNKEYIFMSNSDKNKIESLKNMTQEKGASQGEEENALSLIEKISLKYEGQKITPYEVIGKYPEFKANYKGSIWHIEKDGVLIEKGNKLTIIAEVPDSNMYDINKMEYTESYKKIRFFNRETEYWELKERTLSEEENKAIKALKELVLRLERAVNGMSSCGDGTQATEKEGLEQQATEKMEKVVTIKTKKVKKINPIKRKEINIGDIFKANNYMYQCIKIQENVYVGQRLNPKTWTLSKAQSAIVRWSKESIDRGLFERGKTLYELVEVEEKEEVIKWVKVKPTKENKKGTESKKETENISTDGKKIKYIYTLKKDTDTRTGEEIFVIKIGNKLTKDEFKILADKFRYLSGSYSRFKKGFIFKENPKEKIIEILGKGEVEEDIKFEKVKEIEIIEVKEDIFIDCLVPSINKNGTKLENDEEIIRKSYINKFKITRIVKLNQSQYNNFKDNLLNDYTFLEKQGGWKEDSEGNTLYYFGVAIVCEEEEPLIIDPSGSSYARYCCKSLDNINYNIIR